MKPYETGICVCGKKKEEHLKISSKYSDLFYCYDIGEGDFLDSGTVHLCSEEVASMMLEALRELIHLHACEEEGLQSGRPTAEQWRLATFKGQRAINEALKR